MKRGHDPLPRRGRTFPAKPRPDLPLENAASMPPFENKVLFLGFGAVAQCTLPIFLKHVQVPPKNITVMDFEDQAETLAPWTEQGVRFVRNRVTPDNLGALLGKYLSAGDLLIDLAWNIDCCELLQWCHQRGVLYVNTSVEVWDPYADGRAQASHREDALLAAHEHPPPDGRLERARPHGRARARGQSGPDLALDQARTHRHRREPAGRQAGRPAPRPRKSATGSTPAASTAWPAAWA